jgi:hypothetical protein
MERRKEQRLPESGPIEIRFEDPTAVTVEGTLVETSSRGFRVAHNSKALTPGLEVTFSRADLAGSARVIWTHVLEGRRVSGFVLTGSGSSSGK